MILFFAKLVVNSGPYSKHRTKHRNKQMKLPQNINFGSILDALFKIVIVSFVLSFIGFLVWWAFWVKFVDNYEYGFVYDKYTGKIEPVGKTGWVVRTPWRYSVHTIDIRPYQVQISANERVLNAKLVSFNPKGIDTFVAWHGREAGENKTALLEILKCYAFDVEGGVDCPFLNVQKQLTPAQILKPVK